MKVSNIKCCPSCGEQGRLRHNNRTFVNNEQTRNCYVYCPNCDFRGPRILYKEFESKQAAHERAIELWNRRV